MLVINGFTRFGMVEGLSDEEIPWWLAPYVRDIATLARSSAVLEARNNAAAEKLASLARRISEIAGVARVAAHMKANDPAKAALVAQADRLQKLGGQHAATAA